MAAAQQMLLGAGMRLTVLLTSGTTYTVPTGATHVLMELWGPGGGGGNGTQGGGGGGGGYMYLAAFCVAGNTINYVIGTPGNGATVSSNLPGQTGTNTTLSAILNGSSYSLNANSGAGGTSKGGTGGTASGGTNTTGGNGGAAPGAGGAGANGGAGGSNVGAGGVAPGGGGGGAPVGNGGGTGGAAQIRLTFYT